jgi:sugar lactone lactonase YvrE
MKTIIQGMCCGLMGAALLVAGSAPAQNLFVSTLTSIDEIAPNGTVNTFTTGITNGGSMTFNSEGDLFVASGGSIYLITPGGVKSTFASNLTGVGQMAFNSAGNLFAFSTGGNGSVIEITPGGVESTFASGLLVKSDGLAFNNAGDLFVGTGTDIAEITPGGAKSIFASGLGGNVSSLAFNTTGDLFAMAGSAGNTIFEIAPNGTLNTFATAPIDSDQIAFNSEGNLFVTNPNVNQVLEFNSGGKESLFAAGLLQVRGLAFAVPEPLSGALVAVGLAAFLTCRRMDRGRIFKPHKL